MTAGSRSIVRILAGVRMGSRSAANGKHVRIAFTLDCCDREAITWVATTGGINSGDIHDLMIESVEQRFGLVSCLATPIEWLSDNGSLFTTAENRRLPCEIGLVPCTTPIESFRQAV
jgi:putative transposase